MIFLIQRSDTVKVVYFDFASQKNLIDSGISIERRRCLSCVVVVSEQLSKSGNERLFPSIQTM